MLLITRGRHAGYWTSLVLPDYSHYAEVARIVRQCQTSSGLGMTVDGRLHTSGFCVEGVGLYMHCNLCHKYDTKNRQKQSRVWNKEACTTIRKEKLNMRHPLHREALEHEHACYVVKVQGGNAGQVVHCTSKRCCD